MSQVFSTIITHYGAALEATSKAQGTPISLTALAVGDGNGQVVNPGANAQSLTGEVWRGGINHMYVDPDNPEWTIIEAYIPETTGGFTLREIGVFAEPDILYAVGRTPEIYKPVLSEGASLGLLLRVIVKISSEAHPVLLIDPSKVMATREFVQQELAENSEADRDFSQNLVDQETAILSAHISDIDAHGASVPPAAGSIVLRDSGGRVKSAEPVAAEDVVRLFDKYDLCEFYYFRHPTLKPGFQSAQGGLLTNAATLYPEAWAYLQTTEGQLLCKTEAEWQAMTTAIWHTNADGTTAGWNGIGGAPFYAPDLATGALRLPDLRGMYAEAAGFDSLGAGVARGDRIRNITAASTFHAGGVVPENMAGAFYLINPYPNYPSATNAGSGGQRLGFGADRVVPTGAANAPRAWGALACVYLGLPAS